jgi:hypothetical protein
METNPPLATRPKLSWAQGHLNDLNVAIGEDTKAGRFTAIAQRNTRSAEGGYEVGFPVPPDLRLKYGLMAGDVLQNLRAALDHLAYRLAGNSAGRHTQVPIMSSVTDYANKGVPMILGFGNAAAAAVEQLQPYHAEDYRTDPLWRLNKMSNVDKHRLVHIADFHLTGELIRQVPQGSPPLPLDKVAMHADYESTGALKHGTPIRRIPEPQPGMYVQYDYAVGITFDEVGPAEGGNLVQFLANLGSAVEKVYDLLEPQIPETTVPRDD